MKKLKEKKYTLADYRLMDKKKKVISNAFSTLIVVIYDIRVKGVNHLFK